MAGIEKAMNLTYPSLLDLESQNDQRSCLAKIIKGSGRMPSFESMLTGKEEAIIAYLYDINKARPSRVEADLFEIHYEQTFYQ